MIIKAPEEKDLHRRLTLKLQEYKKRLNPYKAPELQMDTICKLEVLGCVLSKGELDTNALFLLMKELYGDGFDWYAYDNAVGVINAYCTGGADKVYGGTGLPE